MPDAPVVQADFDALLELLDRDTMREIVAMYVESCPQRIAAMHGGLAMGDLVTVATAFHTMRSGCGQLGKWVDAAGHPMPPGCRLAASERNSARDRGSSRR